MAPLSFAFRVLGAAAVSAAATWVAAVGARRIGLLDRPGPRKPHPFPIPLAGGVGVAAGVSVSLVDSWSETGTVIAAVWALVIVGLIDDARDLRARTRLAAQTVVTLPVLLAAAPSLGVPRVVEVGLALLFTLGVISSMNCFDCADGAAASVAVAAALALGWLALGEPSSLRLAAALAGASAGFLLLNAPPARVFLGEGGSTALGFLAAVLVLSVISQASAGERHAALSAAPLALAVPMLDFLLVHFRRVRAGIRNPADLMASAGTDHLPHRLRAAGLGPALMVATCAGATLVSGAGAAAGMAAGLGGALAAAAAVAVAFAGLELVVRGGIESAGRAEDRGDGHRRRAIESGRARLHTNVQTFGASRVGGNRPQQRLHRGGDDDL